MTIVAWEQLPLIVPMDLVCELTGRSAWSLQRLVRLERFPAPMQTYPMKWSRADLEAHWKGQSRKGRRAS